MDGVTMDEDRAVALKLWVVLNRAQHAISRKAGRDMEERGLSLTEFAVLEALYHKGPLALGEVGERILLTSGSLTYVIDKLEDRALLQRRCGEEDRRVTYADLTDRGRQRMDELFPAHAAFLEELMAGLSTAEQRQATALLKRLGYHAADLVSDEPA